jgi:hypothetical protein
LLVTCLLHFLGGMFLVRVILRASILHLCHFSKHTAVVPSFFLRWDQIIYCTYSSTRFEFFAFRRIVCMSMQLIDLRYGFPGPGSCAGTTPMIWSLNLRNKAPCRGLVMKSLIMSLVRHQTNDTSPLSMRSVIKKYRILTCFVRLLLEAFPFFSKKIALVVLEQIIVQNLVSLGFHEVLSPTDRRHKVVGTYDFRFRRASSIELLLSQTPNGKSPSKR